MFDKEGQFIKLYTSLFTTPAASTSNPFTPRLAIKSFIELYTLHIQRRTVNYKVSHPNSKHDILYLPFDILFCSKSLQKLFDPTTAIAIIRETTMSAVTVLIALFS